MGQFTKHPGDEMIGWDFACSPLSQEGGNINVPSFYFHVLQVFTLMPKKNTQEPCYIDKCI